MRAAVLASVVGVVALLATTSIARARPKCPKGSALVTETLAPKAAYGPIPTEGHASLWACGVWLGAVPTPTTVSSCRRGKQWDGPFEATTDRGARLASGACRKDVPHGQWRWVGALRTESWVKTFDKGVLSGDFRRWNADGDLRAEGRYAEGQRVGSWTFCYGTQQCRTESYGLPDRVRSREPVF